MAQLLGFGDVSVGLKVIAAINLESKCMIIHIAVKEDMIYLEPPCTRHLRMTGVPNKRQSNHAPDRRNRFCCAFSANT